MGGNFCYNMVKKTRPLLLQESIEEFQQILATTNYITFIVRLNNM